MFALAILAGIFSYLIFILGILGVLYYQLILVVTIIFVICLFLYFRKEIRKIYLALRKRNTKLDNLSKIFIFLIFTQALVNLMGALAPELSFDALWYHLTLPKIFLENHKIFHISGGLFYYSDMPKLMEMFYVRALALSGEETAKFIHFSFGILSLIALFKLSRKFFEAKYSLLVCLIFYSSLVVAWESTTAYVDLGRTFFEIMALWGFSNFFENKNKKWLIESAVMLGLAISTKLIALGSLPVFIILIIFYEKDRMLAVKNSLIFILISILIPLPWFFYSFLNTGNPIYPILTKLYPTTFHLSLLNPVIFLREALDLFIKADDPISPIYLITFPLLFFAIKKTDKRIRIIILYSFLALIAWYFTPRTGGGRFILPYLPAFSILSVYLINQKKEFRRILIGIAILISISSIGYRFIANAKFIPVVLGRESKQEFLTNNLNFSYGDFYDTDNFFKKNIKKSDKVLLYGFHNLYYVDFPFIDNSFVKKGDKFNYIAVQNSSLPKRFSFWNLIYENPKTHVKVYSMGGMMWSY